MVQTVTLVMSKNGQITIPKAVREILGIAPGDKIVYSVKKSSKTLAITKQKTLEESLLETERELKEMRKKLSPETQEAIWANAGKTAGELRKELDESSWGQDYYRGKYGAKN